MLELFSWVLGTAWVSPTVHSRCGPFVPFPYDRIFAIRYDRLSSFRIAIEVLYYYLISYYHILFSTRRRIASQRNKGNISKDHRYITAAAVVSEEWRLLVSSITLILEQDTNRPYSSSSSVTGAHVSRVVCFLNPCFTHVSRWWRQPHERAIALSPRRFARVVWFSWAMHSTVR